MNIIKKEKWEEFLENLKKSQGNILVAAKKTGIGRTTIYEKRKKDERFRKRMDKILEEQTEEMNDYAEGKLFQAIRAGNLTALIFYLKTRHPKYRIRKLLEIEGKLKVEQKLTKEEKELIEKAINYAIGNGKNKKEDNRKRGVSKKSGRE